MTGISCRSSDRKKPKKYHEKPKKTEKYRKKPKKNRKKPKNTEKNRKKPNATANFKFGTGFFRFFSVFFGLQPPQQLHRKERLIQPCVFSGGGTLCVLRQYIDQLKCGIRPPTPPPPTPPPPPTLFGGPLYERTERGRDMKISGLVNLDTADALK